MKEVRKIARPVREGYAIVDGAECVVWLEHRWNTGEITRMWIVDPREAEALRVLARPVAIEPQSR